MKIYMITLLTVLTIIQNTMGGLVSRKKSKPKPQEVKPKVEEVVQYDPKESQKTLGEESQKTLGEESQKTLF